MKQEYFNLEIEKEWPEFLRDINLLSLNHKKWPFIEDMKILTR